MKNKVFSNEKRGEKKAYFQVIKWGGKVKLKIKYEIFKLKISIDYKEKFKINLLGETVNKQSFIK